MATYTIKIVVAGEDQASGPLRKSKEAVDGLGETSDKSAPKIRGFAEIAIGALRRLGELATEGALAAGGAIAGFVSNAVDQAGTFEAGMNRFGAVTGSALEESGKSLDEFKQLFLDMGAQTQYSAAQAQEAAIALAKGGIDPATLAAGGLSAALNLAAAGELDLAEAAEISAKQFGVWVDRAASAEEKSRFLAQSADLMAQAANASTVNVDDLALGLANAGGVAELAGLSFQETVTTMGLIAPGFSSAADAGTSLKVMLSRLVPTTDAQAEAMAQLGLLTADGTSKFYDATGSFIGMEAAAQLLADATHGMSEEQKQATLNIIFGQDAIRAAAALAEAGADGYTDFAASMDGMGSAAQQAAARNQGFAFALDSAKGSLETFGIVAGSLALPALTALLNEGVIPVVNGATAIASALGDPNTQLGQMASIAGDLVVPAIAGVAAASLAYALTQLPVMIAAVGAATTAFMAQAAAIAAVALPLAAIGVAVAGVAVAWNDFNGKVESATEQLLNSREWWTKSAAAIDSYNSSQLKANKNISATAATIEQLRLQIERETEDLGRRMAAGQVNEEQYQREIGQINAKANALQVATGHLESQIAAENAAAAAGLTATNVAGQLGDATVELGEGAALTADQIEDLGKKLTATYEKGGEAVAAYVSTEVEFLDGVEERRSQHAATIAELEAQKRSATTAEQRAAIDEQIAAAQASYLEQETAAATSYAAQQAAQRAHLGQMLIDYTVNQALLGNIGKEAAAGITAALAEEYGIQESSSSATFLRMAQHIDDFASSGSENISGLITDLQEQETAAVEAEQAMSAMEGEYTATVVANFVEKGGEAADYAATLRNIPKEVRTRVVTEYTETSGTGGRGNRTTGNGSNGGPAFSGTRATGGPISAGKMYLVGEEGPELVVPKDDGMVIPAGPTAAMLAGRKAPGGVGLEAPAMGGAAAGGGGGASIIIQPAVTIMGAVVDNEARLQQLTDIIVDKAVTLSTEALGEAVDGFIQGAGVR